MNRAFKMGIGRRTIDDYGAFVERFKPKRTTDDRYTPPEVYGTIKDRACGEYGMDKAVRKGIYGGGYLMGEAKAAELKAAELKAAEDVTVWPLSENEKRIIENLG